MDVLSGILKQGVSSLYSPDQCERERVQRYSRILTAVIIYLLVDFVFRKALVNSFHSWVTPPECTQEVNRVLDKCPDYKYFLLIFLSANFLGMFRLLYLGMYDS